jgi:AtzE family amidohydrolase
MTDALSAEAGVVDVAAAVRSRRVSVAAVVDTALERVRIANPVLNAFVAVAAERARAHARNLDDAIARGEEIGPLAGVPFAVKAMIDVQSLTTTAGSRLHVDDAPASRDADVVSNLERAGAVCLGALNMDELGMGGTTENALFGPTRNPHDLACTPGGSSGGSAAAVAGRLVPLSVGGDGLGSIRLPASLCGVYGLRPTRGRVCARGTLGSANTLSALGPLARSADDLAAGFAAMAGGDLDPATLARSDRAGLRFAVAGGYFRDGLGAGAAEAVAIAASALEVTDEVEYPEAQRARAAAILINAAESAPPQLANLRRRPGDFDPNTRDRFLAHALMPAAWYLHAMRFRAWHTERVHALLERYDVILLPATPCTAPAIGTRVLTIGGVEQPTGPALGMYAQPLAPTGCPVLAVPIARPGKPPIGVQLLAAPRREADLLCVARHLETRGAARAADLPNGADVSR